MRASCKSTETKNIYVDAVEEMKGADESTASTEIDSYNDEKAMVEYGTTWLAWIQVLNVQLVNACCCIMWGTGSSAPIAVSEWLHVNYTALNWLSNSSAVTTIILSLITGWSFQRFGIKANLSFAAIMNLVGCWIRCTAIFVPEQHRYITVLAGHIIASIGGPFVYNISAKFASEWFAPKHRAIANTIAALPLGIAASPIFIPIIANTSKEVPWMLTVVAIISTIGAIPSLLLPGAPKKPPSPSADQERMPFKEGVKHLFKNKMYMWLVFLASVNAGIIYSVSTLIIEAIAPYGYTEKEAGWCAAVTVLAGFPGGLMASYWAGKSGQYVMLIKILTPVMVFTYITYIFEMIPNAFTVIMIACILNGFFAYALLPLHIELACEISYPVPESLSSSFFWICSTSGTLIFAIIIDALRAGPDANPPHNMKISMIVVACIVGVGSIPVMWLKGDLKRLAVDER